MEPMNRICALCFLVIGLQAFLVGEIQITESVTQFRYPRFSETGFIEWVLEGNSGNYDESDIAIDELKLRIYSGDQLARSLSNISGDNCIFNSETQVASSGDSIQIQGSGFDLSGEEWIYDLSKEIISINSEAFVKFSQNIDSVFSSEEQMGETTISSNRMRLVIEPTRYLFIFEGNCTLSSDSFSLKSNLLELELLNNSKKISFAIPTGELSGMKAIQGEGDVQFISMGEYVESENFSIKPQENKALFGGGALIRYDQIVLKGDLINLEPTIVEVSSYDNNLSSFSDLAQNDEGLINDMKGTFIQSKNISLLKLEDSYEYTFDRDVFLNSELYRINTDWLYLKTNRLPDLSASKEIQDITFIQGKDGVIVKHEDYKISGETLDYTPSENKLELMHKVNYVSDFIQLKSDHLIINNDKLIATGTLNPIMVILPNSADLSFELNENSNMNESSAESDTIIYAKNLEFDNDKVIYDCLFNEDVRLTKGDFSIQSEQLTIKWVASETERSAYAIDTIIANKSAIMEQIAYFASANTIEILPEEKMIHLRGDAHFKDDNGAIWGERINFDRKSKQTKVIGSSDGERARIQFDIFESEEENLDESEKE